MIIVNGDIDELAKTMYAIERGRPLSFDIPPANRVSAAFSVEITPACGTIVLLDEPNVDQFAKELALRLCQLDMAAGKYTKSITVTITPHMFITTDVVVLPDSDFLAVSCRPSANSNFSIWDIACSASLTHLNWTKRNVSEWGRNKSRPAFVADKVLTPTLGTRLITTINYGNINPTHVYDAMLRKEAARCEPEQSEQSKTFNILTGIYGKEGYAFTWSVLSKPLFIERMVRYPELLGVPGLSVMAAGQSGSTVTVVTDIGVSTAGTLIYGSSDASFPLYDVKPKTWDEHNPITDLKPFGIVPYQIPSGIIGNIAHEDDPFTPPDGESHQYIFVNEVCVHRAHNCMSLPKLKKIGHSTHDVERPFKAYSIPHISMYFRDSELAYMLPLTCTICANTLYDIAIVVLYKRPARATKRKSASPSGSLRESAHFNTCVACPECITRWRRPSTLFVRAVQSVESAPVPICVTPSGSRATPDGMLEILSVTSAPPGARGSTPASTCNPLIDPGESGLKSPYPSSKIPAPAGKCGIVRVRDIALDPSNYNIECLIADPYGAAGQIVRNARKLMKGDKVYSGAYIDLRCLGVTSLPDITVADAVAAYGSLDKIMATTNGVAVVWVGTGIHSRDWNGSTIPHTISSEGKAIGYAIFDDPQKDGHDTLKAIISPTNTTQTAYIGCEKKCGIFSDTEQSSIRQQAGGHEIFRTAHVPIIHTCCKKSHVNVCHQMYGDKGASLAASAASRDRRNRILFHT